MKLDDLEIYKLSLELSEDLWLKGRGSRLKG
jgi:hypothetical protein